MKLQPVWWIAVIVFVIYNAIIYSTWWAVDADYSSLTGADVIFKSVVLPLGLGAIFMIAALSYLGWWGPVMTEERRGKPGWTMWALIAVMAGLIVTFFLTTDWPAITATHLAFLILASVFVGFNEEALTRGVAVVGFRGSTQSEVWVWFWTSMLFGLMHLPNGLFGPGLAASMLQVVFTFCAGSGFYLLRRISGTIIVPMFMHGVWDFSTFSHGAANVSTPSVTLLFQFGTYLVSIVLVIVVLRRDRHPATAAS